MLELDNRGARQYGLCSSMAARCARSTLCHSCNPGCHVPVQAAEGTPLALRLTTLTRMHRSLIARYVGPCRPPKAPYLAEALTLSLLPHQ